MLRACTFLLLVIISLPIPLTSFAARKPPKSKPRSAVSCDAVLRHRLAIQGLGIGMLGFDLLEIINKLKPYENNLISPSGIGAALAVLAAGARGDTKKDLDAALKTPKGETLARTGHVWSDLMTELGADPMVPVTITNLFQIGGQGSLVSGFQKYVGKYHHHLAIEGKGNLQAPSGHGSLDITSTASLDIKWATAFNESYTIDGYFRIGAAGTVKRVKMMRRIARLKYVEYPPREPLVKVVSLPLGGRGTYSAYFVQPISDDDDIARVIHYTDADIFYKILVAMEEKEALVKLPRFRIEYNALGFGPILEEVAENPFDRTACDLSGMIAGPDKTVVGDVIHKTVVEFTEKGVGAAPSVVGGLHALDALSSRTQKVWIGNRPFFLAIVHEPTLTPVFLGVLHHPEDVASSSDDEYYADGPGPTPWLRSVNRHDSWDRRGGGVGSSIEDPQ